MILQRSRDFMSSTKVKGPWVRTYTQKNAKILRKYIQEDKNRLRISVVDFWQVKSVAFYWMAERSTSCRNPRSEFCQILSPNNSGKFTVEIYRVPQSICPPCCRWDKPGYLPEIGENCRNPYQTIFSYSVQCDSSAQRPWLGWLRFGEFPRLWAATAATYCPSRMVEHPKSKSIPTQVLGQMNHPVLASPFPRNTCMTS